MVGVMWLRDEDGDAVGVRCGWRIRRGREIGQARKGEGG